MVGLDTRAETLHTFQHMPIERARNLRQSGLAIKSFRGRTRGRPFRISSNGQEEDVRGDVRDMTDARR
jgi:hypothetical protein